MFFHRIDIIISNIEPLALDLMIILNNFTMKDISIVWLYQSSINMTLSPLWLVSVSYARWTTEVDITLAFRRSWHLTLITSEC